MKAISVFLVVIVLAVGCKNNTKQVSSADETIAVSPAITVDTTSKNSTIEFVSYSFGDLPHYMFKDQSTMEEMEVEFDEDDRGYSVAKDEIDNSCDDNGHCKMAGQKYKATFQLKLVDIYDWNGEVSVPTGAKEKRWILTTLTKMT
jgi:hypothetical protein